MIIRANRECVYMGLQHKSEPIVLNFITDPIANMHITNTDSIAIINVNRESVYMRAIFKSKPIG